MKLEYSNKLVKMASGLVLTKAPKRIELHIKRRDQSTFMLVCIAGLTTDQPPTNVARNKQHTESPAVIIKASKAQGPFHSLEQTQGATNAIVAALERDGFIMQETKLLWEIAAQKICNVSKNLNHQASGDYSFDPNDVY